MRSRGLLFILFLNSFLGRAHAACECPPYTPQEQLELATYAFTGRVSEIRSGHQSATKTIVLDVIDTFKGSPQSEILVVDAMAGTECDLGVQEGESYLVYARWEWGQVVTSRCLGTKPVEKAHADAKVLGLPDAAKEKMYSRLQEACMGRRDTPCCLASVRAMREGYFVPEPEGGCPAGMAPDRLRCAGSYRWCIPPAQKDHRLSR